MKLPFVSKLFDAYLLGTFMFGVAQIGNALYPSVGFEISLHSWMDFWSLVSLFAIFWGGWKFAIFPLGYFCLMAFYSSMSRMGMGDSPTGELVALMPNFVIMNGTIICAGAFIALCFRGKNLFK